MIEYQYASDKGTTNKGDLISNPFGFGKVDADFTGSRVVEPVMAAGTFAPSWTNVSDKGFKVITVDGKVEEFDARKTYTAAEKATIEFKAYKVTKADATVVYADNAPTVEVGDKVAYVYDNVAIPQNDLPMIKAEMKSISLVAKARRIAVYYSQIAAYQAKTDYGVDLGDQLAEKAVGELSYEIDTEIVKLLCDNAKEFDDLTFSKTLPVGVSKSEHYDSFSEILEIGKDKIYSATQKFAPNYMLIASNCLPVLTMMKSWKAAPTGAINGPYFAGTIGALKVFVSPAIERNTFVLGCNGNDMMSSAAVYAPYMAIVPTQLLGYADGGMSQGWSTLYDLQMLNKNLLVKGRIVD